jgi:hypothetical protein
MQRNIFSIKSQIFKCDGKDLNFEGTRCTNNNFFAMQRRRKFVQITKASDFYLRGAYSNLRPRWHKVILIFTISS